MYEAIYADSTAARTADLSNWLRRVESSVSDVSGSYPILVRDGARVDEQTASYVYAAVIQNIESASPPAKCVLLGVPIQYANEYDDRGVAFGLPSPTSLTVNLAEALSRNGRGFMRIADCVPLSIRDLDAFIAEFVTFDPDYGDLGVYVGMIERPRICKRVKPADDPPSQNLRALSHMQCYQVRGRGHLSVLGFTETSEKTAASIGS